MSSPQTMKAVIFNGPFDISVETRPVPTIKSPSDAVLKVEYTALCGSELHVFRGHQKSPTGFIMGHEFTGVVSEVGADVKDFKVGDKVVVPFTISCGNCFYCKRGASSRCKESLLFGTAALDGGQADYVRIPLADATLVKQPVHLIEKKFGGKLSPEDLKKQERKFVLMADIFPTGYFAAKNSLKDFNDSFTSPQNIQADGPPAIVVLGCGPVGLCGIISITHLAPKGTKIFAVDSVPERLAEAQKLGATPVTLDFSITDITDERHPVSIIKKATNGRGADAAMEIVGHSDALRLAFDVVRPWGRIASVGVHNADIPIGGNEAYGKNITMQFGRCPVRSTFDEALLAFVDNLEKLDVLMGHFMKVQDAVEAYDLFDKRKVQKVVFTV